jgi:hypothetical protein
MKKLVYGDVTFWEGDVIGAKKYFHFEDTEGFDEFAIDHNQEIADATTLEEIAEAYNKLTDDYGSGETCKIVEEKPITVYGIIHEYIDEYQDTDYEYDTKLHSVAEVREYIRKNDCKDEDTVIEIFKEFDGQFYDGSDFDTPSNFMKRTEPQGMYDRNNTVQIKMKLNKNTDADIIEFLNQQPNKQGYLKNLIRSNMPQVCLKQSDKADK